MKRALLQIAIALGTTCLWYSTSIACSCYENGSVEEEYQRAKVVFAGRCVGAKLIKSQTKFLDGHWNVEYVFEIEKTWKGSGKKEISIYTGIGHGDCGFEFQIGNCYIVYAYEHEGVLETGICTRTLVTNVLFYDPIKASDIVKAEVRALNAVSAKPRP